MPTCARCRRPVLHLVTLAGMTLGARCAQLVREACGAPAPAPAQIDPRQLDLLTQQDAPQTMPLQLVRAA